jgi:aryl-alcohol dehydrogenase-like predicted oxidoreductase
MELSGLGMGTYLGEVDEEKDAGYTDSAQVFFRGGGTVFDTAANYRCGRSERALGEAFRKLPREEFFVSTKAGYLPMGDGVTQETPRAWFQRVLHGILEVHDIIDGCHAMTPRYLSHQLDVSLRALGVDKVDLFHIHNPEQQRPSLGPEAFHRTVRAAFEACERFVQEGRIGEYGCATWNGFRVLPDHPGRLCLEELLQIAEEVGGSGHHFRWIQLPLNLTMPEALLQPTQRFGGREMPILEAARLAGLQVQTSASLMQSRILATLPRDVIDAFGCRTAAQAALQFTRSCPGVTVALAGMSHPAHVRENLTVLALPKLTEEVVKGLYS